MESEEGLEQTPEDKRLSETDSAPGSCMGLGLDSDTGIRGVAWWEWNLMNDEVRLSPEWRRIMHLKGSGPLRYPHEQWGKNIPEEDFQELLECSEKVRTGECEDIRQVFRMLRNDNCWAWLLIWGRISRWENGRPANAMGTITDISAMRSDPKFQQGNVGVGNAAYHAMLENSPDLLVRMDRELFPLYMNPVVSRYMGREAHEYSYSEDLDELRLDPRHLDFLRKNVDWVFRTGSSIREEVSFTDAYGREVTGEYSFWPEFDSESAVVSAMTHFRDLTDKMEAEKRARHNEKRVEALYRLTQMTDAPETEVMRFVLRCLIDLTHSRGGFLFIPQNGIAGQGQMAWVSDGEEFFGDNYRLGKGVLDALAALGADERDNSSYRLLINGDGEKPVIGPDVAAFAIMRAAVVPVLENGRIVCLAGAVNKEKDYVEPDLQQCEMFISGAWLVLRRHDHIRELRAAKEAAEHANRVKDEFLANVSHELRTPLNGLLAMMQLMEDMPLNDEQREYIRAANLSGNALLRIISDILDYSRMTHGKMELRSEIFDLKQTVHSALSLFRGEAARKELGFGLVLDRDIPDRLLGDDARVRQIIFNLVGNALKFTEKGYISVEGSLVSGGGDDGRVRFVLSVSDTGIGIPPEQQSRIFDAFTQVDSSPTRKYSGTGLGLGIVKHLVALMNGSISLESEVGRGTRVSCVLELELPLVSAEGQARFPGTDEDVAASLDILVAEDDSVSRFAIRSFLNRMGHRTVCVDNGTEALEALKLYSFHCLLTDIQMPDMDGLELAGRIRESRNDDIRVSEKVRSLVRLTFPGHGQAESPVDRNIAIVAVSAHAMAGDRERFLKRGMDYYISKPIVGEDLSLTLTRLTADLRRAGKL